MGKILGTFILPHPPIMIYEVGGRETERIQKTIDAANEIGARIRKLQPDTVIVISPHGPLFSDAVTIAMEDWLEGSLSRFGAADVKMKYQSDRQLAEQIIKDAEESDILCLPMTENMKKTYHLPLEMDHGAVVPLYFIESKHQSFKLVHITYSLLPHEIHYKLGMVIKAAVEKMDSHVVVIASGDLSHRLTAEAPSGYDPLGAVFDTTFVDYLKEGKVEDILNMPPELVEAAGECGYRSAVILMGCLDGCHIRGEILSYEGPFGVGYCVAQLFAEQCGTAKNIIDTYIESKKKHMRMIRESEDAYVSLARKALENYIRTGKQLKGETKLPKAMLKEKAGVFVSIKKNGELRGCIGTISPTAQSIKDEIMQNAVSSGTRDPRFPPVEEDELDALVYSVDILRPAETISSKAELDVIKYGVIVKSGQRSGLLLPNLEGVNTVEEQVAIALKKAGIDAHENYTMERFEVIRHK